MWNNMRIVNISLCHEESGGGKNPLPLVVEFGITVSFGEVSAMFHHSFFVLFSISFIIPSFSFSRFSSTFFSLLIKSSFLWMLKKQKQKKSHCIRMVVLFLTLYCVCLCSVFFFSFQPKPCPVIEVLSHDPDSLSLRSFNSWRTEKLGASIFFLSILWFIDETDIHVLLDWCSRISVRWGGDLPVKSVLLWKLLW